MRAYPLSLAVHPDTRDPQSDVTLLYMATARGDYNGVETLIAYSADICLERSGHGTALHAAVEGGWKKVTELLLSAGADVNLQYAILGTPLTVLMAKRWKFSCLDMLGLKYPFGDCHRCCAKILLDWGADADAVGEYGTAFETAKKWG